MTYLLSLFYSVAPIIFFGAFITFLILGILKAYKTKSYKYLYLSWISGCFWIIFAFTSIHSQTPKINNDSRVKSNNRYEKEIPMVSVTNKTLEQKWEEKVKLNAAQNNNSKSNFLTLE